MTGLDHREAGAQPSTLVLQSCAFADRPEQRPAWLKACQESVARWAERSGYSYRLEGDALFARNPAWLNAKLAGRGPIKSDVARLRWAREALKRYERVVWLDADVLIFSPERFKPCALLRARREGAEQAKKGAPGELTTSGGFLFGLERWVQPHKKGLRYGWQVYQNLCNALCVFERGNPFLEFYLYSAESIISRIDAEYIAPQVIGPKLLTAQNNLTQLPCTTLLGSASVDLLIDLSEGEGPALTEMVRRLDQDPPEERCVALNLCGSLVGRTSHSGERLDEARLESAIHYLLARGL